MEQVYVPQCSRLSANVVVCPYSPRGSAASLLTLSTLSVISEEGLRACVVEYN
jgi:hypothetical protein